MTSPVDDAATADTVVEGVTALMVVMLNPSCYSDSSGKFSVCQVAKGRIPPTCILIFRQLTLNLFENADLMVGIKTVTK